MTPFLLPTRQHALGWHVEGWAWASLGSQSPQAGSALRTWRGLAGAGLHCCSVFLAPAVFPVSRSQPERPFWMVSSDDLLLWSEGRVSGCLCVSSEVHPSCPHNRFLLARPGWVRCAGKVGAPAKLCTFLPSTDTEHKVQRFPVAGNQERWLQKLPSSTAPVTGVFQIGFPVPTKP